jgi:hypothetical protein
LSAVCSASVAFTGDVLFVWVPLGSWAFALGKNLPKSINGEKVMTVPAAAINFRKSRLDTREPLLFEESPRLNSITFPATWGGP